MKKHAHRRGCFFLKKNSSDHEDRTHVIRKKFKEFNVELESITQLYNNSILQFELWKISSCHLLSLYSLA